MTAKKGEDLSAGMEEIQLENQAVKGCVGVCMCACVSLCAHIQLCKLSICSVSVFQQSRHPHFHPSHIIKSLKITFQDNFSFTKDDTTLQPVILSKVQIR